MKTKPSPEELSTMRTCTKCNVEKPLSYYYRLGEGYEKVCKDCRDRLNGIIKLGSYRISHSNNTKIIFRNILIIN